ncbi:MAG: hypothetical protein EVB03_09455 [SAR92 clade bacterium]|uniref:Uncharacterized protein n=1 Tax=SAR92 clade bacterium TaxID=2315479 RepID=A0A520MC60_9GAMM|nr:MAG: hypothetical protein EVB03_09455 [SAR92 clade bacterium]
MIKSFSVLSLSLLFILSSCGGGGSAKTTTVTPPTFEPPGEVIQIESEVSLGQSTELVLYAPDSDISNILWRQTAGADLEFYAKDSKVIGFTPAESGSYGLEVDYTIDGSTTNTISHTFTVDDNQSQLSVRLGHAVVEGNAVSLVSYATNDSESNEIDKSSWRWTQTKGPSVVFSELSTNGQVAVFFDAPNVDEDTVLKFALAGEIEGEGHTDEIAILVENSTISVPLDDAPFTNRVANVFLYNPNSPAGEQLINCVYSNNTKYDDCNFGQSPLIAQVTTSPTVDDIMNRVIVSHQWMGDQFKKFLENYDTNDDFKNLLRATTAVVISYDIRPSFYSPTLGAIYLDPDDLWETPAQRDTINQAPDYRADFGAELQFEMPWRYVKDNAYAYYSYPLRYRLSRSLDDSKYSFASLLYHELAHANDFFPSTRWLTYSNSTTVYDAVVEVYNANQILSDYLQDNYPLDALYASGGQNELTRLAQVRFQDPSLVTQQQIEYTMTDVANMFKTEGAPQFYSYSSTREDLAILFDGFMMFARYGVSRDVAVSDQQYSDIVWGQRGRIGESWIKPRVSFVATRVLPEFTSAATVVQNLSSPTALQDSKSWRESVVVDELSEFSLTPSLRTSPTDSRLVPRDGVPRHRGLEPHFEKLLRN